MKTWGRIMKALIEFINQNKINNEVDFSKFEELAIKVTKHPEYDIYKLNYNQIDSPKMNSVVQDCRGTIIDKFGNPVAVSFSRFFNLGEALEVTDKFDWSNFSASSKEDGSLIVMYNFNNQWNVSTRGSFANQEICEGGPRWDDLVFSLLKDRMEYLIPTETYIFELCSLYNKVVTEYKTPTLYLLSVFETKTGMEYSSTYTDVTAVLIDIKRPEKFQFTSIEEVKSYITALEELDPTQEGLVLKDCNRLRIKIKSKLYLSLHQLKGNGSIICTKNIVPFILAGEIDEVLSYFPEIEMRVREVEAEVKQLYQELYAAFIFSEHIEDQKEFAFAICECRMKGILFNLKKRGKLKSEEVMFEFRNSSELIIKLLKQD